MADSHRKWRHILSRTADCRKTEFFDRLLVVIVSDTAMQVNSFVIVNLHSPKERFVGRLIGIGAPGVTLRGLDLMSFEDWMNDVSKQEESGVRPTTIFFPLHRVEKIMLDENLGGIPSLANTFLTRIGASIDEYLE